MSHGRFPTTAMSRRIALPPRPAARAVEGSASAARVPGGGVWRRAARALLLLAHRSAAAAALLRLVAGRDQVVERHV